MHQQTAQLLQPLDDLLLEPVELTAPFFRSGTVRRLTLMQTGMLCQQIIEIEAESGCCRPVAHGEIEGRPAERIERLVKCQDVTARLMEPLEGPSQFLFMLLQLTDSQLVGCQRANPADERVDVVPEVMMRWNARENFDGVLRHIAFV